MPSIGMDPVLLHAHADDEDARVLRCHPHRLLDHARHTDGFEDHERTHAVDLAPRLDRRRLARIDDDVGAELLGELPALRARSRRR